MNTKEIVTPFGSSLHLPTKIYNEFVKKFKELQDNQPENYNLNNGKEITNKWFSEESPEEVVKKIYEYKY